MAMQKQTSTVESARRLQYSNACGRYGRYQWSARTRRYYGYIKQNCDICWNIRQRNVENNKKDCFPSAMPAQALARHISGPPIKWRSPAETGSRKLADTVAERRFRLAGHILRLPSHRPSKVAMSWTLDDGRQRRRRPNMTGHGTLHFRKTWREPTSHGKRLNTLRRIVLSDVNLLPTVPTGTGGTKSK